MQFFKELVPWGEIDTVRFFMWTKARCGQRGQHERPGEEQEWKSKEKHRSALGENFRGGHKREKTSNVDARSGQVLDRFGEKRNSPRARLGIGRSEIPFRSNLFPSEKEHWKSKQIK